MDSHEYDDDRDDFASLGIIGARVHAEADQPEESEITTFTVTNPQGSVSVSTLLDGSVHYVHLSESASGMSEARLADEIRVIADLARQKALSAQYTFIQEKMADEDAKGSAMLREFMGIALKLPSPEEAAATQAEVFTARYGVC